MLLLLSVASAVDWAEVNGEQMQKMLQHEGYEMSFPELYVLEDIKLGDKYITIFNDVYDLYLMTYYEYNTSSDEWIEEGIKLEDDINANSSAHFSLGISLDNRPRPVMMIVVKKYPHESLSGMANPKSLIELLTNFSNEVDNAISGNLVFPKVCTPAKRPHYQLITGALEEADSSLTVEVCRNDQGGHFSCGPVI